MNDVIYHYCSVDTFNEIISNKCIRLSDLNKTNDYMEKKWISKLIEEALIREFKELDIDIQLREDYWYEDGIENHISYLKDMMEYFLQKPTYISCFSKNSDKLSQWRAYGNNGTGIAIGFDFKKLKKVKCSGENIFIEEVLYKKNKQLEAIQSTVTKAVGYMLAMFESDTVKVSDNFNIYFIEEFDAFCEVICDYLNPLSCYIKNRAFAEEEEVRVFYSPDIYISMDKEEIDKHFLEEKDINSFSLQPIKFQAKNYQIVGYTDLVFKNLISDNIITEIVIGPSSKVSEDDIYYLLLSHGYDANSIKVSKSEATYK